jgi:hypothetical protein
MSKHRLIGLLVLLLAMTFLVPLGFTCAITASESPVTHDQSVRLVKMANQLNISALVAELVAASLLRGKPLRPLRFAGVVRFTGVVIGCVVVGFLGGSMISDFFFFHWSKLVRVLM